MVCHRRAGKTVACVNDLIAKAIYSKRKRPRYGYIGPFRNQAKKIAWEYLKEYTYGITDKPPSEGELSVTLAHNKAEICIYGADNPNAFRGQYFDGVVQDEVGDQSPLVWSQNLLPTLADRHGWAVFIGTPKGRNHFYNIFNRSKAEQNWFSFMLRASESHILSDEELELQRREMSEEEYQQEYECSFDAAILGAYYGKIIDWLEQNRRITMECEFDPNFPVVVATDLGFTDSTAIWYAQERPDGYAIIDYDEHSNEPLDFYVNLLQNKPYEYSMIWLPHDARAKTLQTGRSTIEQLISTGLPFDITPNLSRQHGIDAARMFLHDCWFNPRCSAGIEALRNYHREFDHDRKVFSDKPAHDWSSHGSDAFRYLSLVLRRRILRPPELDTSRQLVIARPKLEELFKHREDTLNRRVGRV